MTAGKNKRQCREISIWGMDYLAGRLLDADQLAAEKHLEKCSVCRRELKILQFADHLAKVTDQGAVPPEKLFWNSRDGQRAVRPETLTVKDIVALIRKIHFDRTISAPVKRQKVIRLINAFLVESVRFILGRRKPAPGPEWMRMERRCASLLQKVLDDIIAAKYRDVVRLQAEAYLSQGIIFQLQDRFTEAEGMLGRALAIAWAMGETESSIVSQRILGEIEFYRGRYREAAVIFQAALSSARKAKSLQEECTLLRNLGNIRFIQKKLEESLELLESALKISDTFPDPTPVARDLNNLAGIYFRQGAARRACEYCEQALLRLNKKNSPHLQGQLHSNLGTFYSAFGNLDEAREQWKEAIQLFSADGSPDDLAHLHRNVALTEYRLLNFHAVTQELDRVLDLDPSDPVTRIQALLLRGRAHRRVGDPKTATADHKEALKSAKKLNDLLLIRTAYRELAFNAFALGNEAEVRKNLDAGNLNRKKWPRVPDSVFKLEDQFLLGKIAHKYGNSKEAKRRYKELRTVYNQLLKQVGKRVITPNSKECDYWRELVDSAKDWR